MMILSPLFVKTIFLGFATIIVGLILVLIEKRFQISKRLRQGLRKRKLLPQLSKAMKRQQTSLLLRRYQKLQETVIINQQKQDEIADFLANSGLFPKYKKQLYSHFSLKRMEAVRNLKVMKCEEIQLILENALKREKNRAVKLYLANAISDLECPGSLPVLVESLLHENRWYRIRVNGLIANYREKFLDFLPQIMDKEEFEYQELIIQYASSFWNETLKEYLLRFVDRYERLPEHLSEFEKNNSQYLLRQAMEILSSTYPHDIMTSRYLESNNSIIRDFSIQAISYEKEEDTLDVLLKYAYRPSTYPSAYLSIVRLLQKRPPLCNHLIKHFLEEEEETRRLILAEFLSRSIDYLIMQYDSQHSKTAEIILRSILKVPKLSGYLNFLNSNKDIDLENKLLALLKNTMENDPSIIGEISRELQPRILQKLGLKLPKAEPRISAPSDYRAKISFIILIIVSLLIPLLLYLLRYQEIIAMESFWSHLKRYIVHFIEVIAFYYFALNAWSLILMGISIIYVSRQSKRWNLKSYTFLFKKQMLPSISIIAPAFNEEKTIIESTNSLLNLLYPDYELIVVNDGSNDRTLETLIQTYQLKKIDLIYQKQLETSTVLGIYQNPDMPRLIVVNKRNGGKADSLNTGINIAQKEFFCGIDADSLLERDSLLKLASMQLDTGVETPALGGNIFPINGCKVIQGDIVDIRIPKHHLARFQTMEYMRAFMSGRLGWAAMNSLLIISGAFGLFRKERVVSVGGYLTRSGKYKRDTVGEDMELVVRISRFMKEHHYPYKIDYAYHANCWTEVPEDFKSLRKQRYRWHRGLIQILWFHRKLLFHPKYGSVGLIAFPYFFLFEFLGPLFEFQGTIFILIGLIFGWLNTTLILFLFVVTIEMGIIISIVSLIIAEKDTPYFSIRDLFTLLFYAIIENFGPRQYFSFWRVSGLIRLLKHNDTWGKAKRKGFASSSPHSL